MTKDRLPLPEGVTRLQLLRLADDARAEADRRHCYSQLVERGDGKYITRCVLDTGHDGPHLAELWGNGPTTSVVNTVAISWETS